MEPLSNAPERVGAKFTLIHKAEYAHTYRCNNCQQEIKQTPASMDVLGSHVCTFSEPAKRPSVEDANDIVIIPPSPTADTRSCDWSKVSIKQLCDSSVQHREDVVKGFEFFVRMMRRQARLHDYDKLSDIEGFHRDFKTGFAQTDWWDTHRKINRHHLLQPDGVPDDVNLVDIFDLIVDCTVAGMARTGDVFPITVSDDVLRRAFENTCTLLRNHVSVVASERVPEPVPANTCTKCGVYHPMVTPCPLPERHEWLSMDSAPKDGMPVLVVYRDGAILKSKWEDVDWDERTNQTCWDWVGCGAAHSEHDAQPIGWLPLDALPSPRGVITMESEPLLCVPQSTVVPVHVEPQKDETQPCELCIDGKISVGCSIDKPLIQSTCPACKGTGRVPIDTKQSIELDIPIRASTSAQEQQTERERLEDEIFQDATDPNFAAASAQAEPELLPCPLRVSGFDWDEARIGDERHDQVFTIQRAEVGSPYRGISPVSIAKLFTKDWNSRATPILEVEAARIWLHDTFVESEIRFHSDSSVRIVVISDAEPFDSGWRFTLAEALSAAREFAKDKKK